MHPRKMHQIKHQRRILGFQDMSGTRQGPFPDHTVDVLALDMPRVVESPIPSHREKKGFLRKNTNILCQGWNMLYGSIDLVYCNAYNFMKILILDVCIYIYIHINPY